MRPLFSLACGAGRNDAAHIRQMLNNYLGWSAERIEINCTENNSVYSNPGKQATSLVNGLFLADSLGNIVKTEFRSFFWWDFRNGQETGNNNSSYLYGWRRYGDYGIVNSGTPAGPADRATTSCGRSPSSGSGSSSGAGKPASPTTKNAIWRPCVATAHH